MTYKEKLLDPRWQKKRLEILNRDKFTCQKCGDDKRTLHVHHRRYFPKIEPWDIPNNCLVTLCDICHEGECCINDVIADLGEVLKESFFESDIVKIFNGFYRLEIQHISEVVASEIEWLLSSRQEMKRLEKRYFANLSKKRCDNV